MAQGTVDRLDLDAPSARRLRRARGSSVRAGAARAPSRYASCPRAPTSMPRSCCNGSTSATSASGSGSARTSSTAIRGLRRSRRRCSRRNSTTAAGTARCATTRTRHSSFHTTFNVLENLRIAAARGVGARASVPRAEARALEFMLEHRLYRSDKTGEVITERFTHLTYPWHWHYTVLRGLDYMRLTPEIGRPAPRRSDPVALEQRKPNGRWPLQKRIPGTLLVEMERPAERAAGTRCGCFASCAGEIQSRAHLSAIERARRPSYGRTTWTRRKEEP